MDFAGKIQDSDISWQVWSVAEVGGIMFEIRTLRSFNEEVAKRFS